MHTDGQSKARRNGGDSTGGRKLLSGTVVHVNDALAYVRLHARDIEGKMEGHCKTFI